MSMTSNSSRQKRTSWSLRSLLLLFIPICALLAYKSHVQRQCSRAHAALELMTSKGVDLNVVNGLEHAVIIFKNGNVTDADLERFVPAFNGHLSYGAPHIEAIRLMSSKVSPGAVRRFRQAVPQCKLSCSSA
jgi:hypothetical protein